MKQTRTAKPRRRLKLWVQDLGILTVITSAILLVGHLDWLGFDLNRKPCWPLIFGLLLAMVVGFCLYDPDDPRHEDPRDWDDWEDSEF